MGREGGKNSCSKCILKVHLTKEEEVEKKGKNEKIEENFPTAAQTEAAED